MDKILQFLQLLLILEVVSSRECYLKNLSEKWCNKEMKILFDESEDWETFDCSNKDCGSNITFFTNDKFKEYLTDKINNNNSITELFVYENYQIRTDEMENLQHNLTEENLALIKMEDVSLVIRNESGTDEYWQLINVGTQNKEYLQIGQLGSTVVLMNNTHLYELGDPLKDICIEQRHSNCLCSRSALQGTVDPKTFICEGQKYIETRINLTDSRVFMFSDKKCSEQCEIKNIT
ncbi:uncharacterized protein LOC106867078 isoform X2 [Octopus bimaculoides]|uniref:uncharacterized protein LOC106867078 isoform X2 n=1 Tax=Octopus bimaculoides TaxID=37653 RepID=UPI0022E7073E|nr:uncharacterized protein LOC106867078 isoform X2 [Octopus bimaculoides]